MFMKLQQSSTTVLTLANASELVCRIAQGVVGNDVADTFNGTPLTRGTLYQLAQTEFQNALGKHLGSN
jgi:hypothetical protein